MRLKYPAFMLLLVGLSFSLNVTILSPQSTTYYTAWILVNITNSSDAVATWFFNGTDNQTYTEPVYVPYAAGSHTLTAYVNDSLSNINSSSVTFTVSANDPYEQDDNTGQANWILTNNTAQTHGIFPANDQDWMKFNGTVGSKYLIKTSALVGGTDTILYVYHYDGGWNVVGYNDDISLGENLSSSVLFLPQVNGTYYIAVIDYSSSFSGGFYDISVQQLGRLYPYLISPASNITVNQNEYFNFSAGVKCLGGPCLNVKAILDPIEEEIKLNEKLPKDISSEIEKTGSASVIVKLKKGVDVDSMLSSIQESIQAMSPAKKLKFKVLESKSLKRIGLKKDWFSGRLTAEEIELLENDPRIESITYDRILKATLDNSVPQIRANDTWTQQVNGTNLTGTGQTVCIVDTGINYSHPDFTGGVYVGGYDFVNNDSDPMDDEGHGSHVAGIVASQDATYKGVAPGARIAAVKVLDSGGSGSTSDIIAGIEWCINNSDSLNISVISMSLGTEGVRHTIPCADDTMASTIYDALSENITVVAASGNEHYGSSGSAPGIHSPACIPGVVSIGGATDADAITYNRALLLGLVAPGVSIMATDYDGTHIPYSGTSMATPHAAGMAAIIQQTWKLKYNRMPTVNEMENIIRYEGVPIVDSSGTGLRYFRADAWSSTNAKGITPMNSGNPFYTITQNPSSYFNLTEGETMNFTWTVKTTSDNGTYNFFAVFEDNATDYNLTSSVNVTISGSGNVSNGTAVNLNGANLTNISHHTRYNVTAGNASTEGGNISGVNISAAQLTERWAAFYGDVIGQILLTDVNGLNHVYSWNWTASNGGAVCLSTNSSLSVLSVVGANGTDIDTAWNLSSSSTDSGTNTFISNNCTMNIGSATVANASYVDTGAAGGFLTCAMKSSSTPAKDEMLFCTDIISGGTLWNGGTGDFEVMVPTPEGPGTTETYYFYANLE